MGQCMDYSSKILSVESWMDYQEYIERVKLLINLHQINQLKESEDAMMQLILSDISDLDKADLCVRQAEAYDRRGNIEGALGWFDKGITYEQPSCHYEVAEKKAEYLSQLGRNNDAIRIYEWLVKQPFVREIEKERMRSVLKNILGKTMGSWQ